MGMVPSPKFDFSIATSLRVARLIGMSQIPWARVLASIAHYTEDIVAFSVGSKNICYRSKEERFLLEI